MILATAGRRTVKFILESTKRQMRFYVTPLRYRVDSDVFMLSKVAP